jgi:hypothetical protein
VDADAIRHLNGVLLLVGSLCLLRQLYWQIRVRARDWQQRSAFILVAMTGLLTLQYGLAALEVVPGLSTGYRGTATFIGWVAAVVYWTICTELHNRQVLRDITSGKTRL